MPYRIAYDAANAGSGDFWMPALGLVFVLLGWFLVFKPAAMLKVLPSGLQGKARKIFSWIFFGFALLWTLVSFTVTFVQHAVVKDALKSGDYSVSEGKVTHFVPMPRSGHALESFMIGEKKFSYSDYLMNGGFRNTASHGGPIREGLQVRVSHVGNLILRLEIAE